MNVLGKIDILALVVFGRSVDRIVRLSGSLESDLCIKVLLPLFWFEDGLRREKASLFIPEIAVLEISSNYDSGICSSLLEHTIHVRQPCFCLTHGKLHQKS